MCIMVLLSQSINTNISINDTLPHHTVSGFVLVVQNCILNIMGNAALYYIKYVANPRLKHMVPHLSTYVILGAFTTSITFYTQSPKHKHNTNLQVTKDNPQ